MAAQKIKVQYQGREVGGVDVPVDESNERWTDVLLQDGTRLRIKSSIVSVARLDEFDAQDNPVYFVNATPVLVIGEVPQELKRKKN